MIDRIRKDMLQARKNKDYRLLTILSTFVSEAEKIGKDNGNRASTDSEVISVLKKFINNINENIRISKNINQEEKKGYEFEVSVLEKYLPKQLSDEKLLEEIDNIISQLVDVNPKMIGKVMAELKSRHGGLYDGKIASQLIKDKLSN